jgi:hypothetical protein
MFDRANWQVVWVSKGHKIAKDYGDDFVEALRIYTLAVKAGKAHTTLRCKNFGIPPPKRWRPHMEEYKIRGDRQVHERWVEPIRKANLRGLWYCPYCGGFRRFVKRKGFRTQGVRVDQSGYHCPMCNISHRDSNVRKWNPVARKVMNTTNTRQTRGTSTSPAAIRRRRRRDANADK